jgi:hypothetical protein
MPGIMKQAKLKAIMDIISQMDDMEMDRLMPKDKMDMEYNEEIKPEKKGLTIVKLESDKNFMNLTETELLESFCHILIKIIQIILKSAIWYEIRNNLLGKT